MALRGARDRTLSASGAAAQARTVWHASASLGAERISPSSCHPATRIPTSGTGRYSFTAAARTTRHSWRARSLRPWRASRGDLRDACRGSELQRHVGRRTGAYNATSPRSSSTTWDATYRTIASPPSRAIAGISMGGDRNHDRAPASAAVLRGRAFSAACGWMQMRQSAAPPIADLFTCPAAP